MVSCLVKVSSRPEGLRLLGSLLATLPTLGGREMVRRSRSIATAKGGIKRGPWSAEEDEILVNYIRAHGEGRWEKIPGRTGLARCGKSSRLRWLNYLRPDIKRGNISLQEEDLILRLHKLLGNRWSLIARRLPGRTDNEIKNYWNVTLRKKLQRQAPSYSPTSSPEKPGRAPTTAEDPTPDAHNRLPGAQEVHTTTFATAAADGDEANRRTSGCTVGAANTLHCPPNAADDGDDRDRDGWWEALRLCDGDLQLKIDDRFTMSSVQRSMTMSLDVDSWTGRQAPDTLFIL